MTNEEINERIHYIEGNNSTNMILNYISDDAFCFRVMRDNDIVTSLGVAISPDCKSQHDAWITKHHVTDTSSYDKSLNKAILLTCIKIKGVDE